MKTIYYTLFLFVLFSCKNNDPNGPISSTSTSTSTSVTTTPVTGKSAWIYDSLVLSSVTDNMVKATPGVYCPSYSLVDKKNFWVQFNKAITRAESAWDPLSQMTEKFIDSLTGKLAISGGLLQLSVGDRLNYHTPTCSTLSSNNILDPATNIKCGMEIEDKLIGSRGTMQESLGRYWSTVRDNNNSTDGEKLTATVARYMPQCFVRQAGI